MKVSLKLGEVFRLTDCGIPPLCNYHHWQHQY